MSSQDFTRTLTVDQSPEEAFAAINNVRDWWSGEIEGATHRVGDEFMYRYQDLHYSKQRVTEMIPGQRVVWRVSDSALSFVEPGDEWNDTEIVFEIARIGDKTEVRFTHVGLAPDRQCYGACSRGWSHYITGALQNLIARGSADQRTIA